MMFDRRAIAGGLLSAAFARSAWTRQPEAKPAVDEDPTRLDATLNRNDHLLAPVTINGRGPFKFLLDTGASASCVSERVALANALPAATPARVVTIVGIRMAPRVIIAELGVGTRLRRNVKTAVLPIRDPMYDGVLGVDWLEKQRLHIDFRSGELEIGRSRIEESERGKVVVPARRRLGQLTIIDADLGGRSISCLIDTGSQVTVCNAALAAIAARQDRTPQAREAPEMMILQTLLGETLVGRWVHLPFVRLGGLTVGAARVIHADAHVFKMWNLEDTPALILGMDLLTQFRAVALDYGRSAVRFDLA